MEPTNNINDNNNNNNHNNNTGRVLVKNFREYYKVTFGDNPVLQTNRSIWFSPWGGHLRPDASVEEICNEINCNHENMLFVVFPTKNSKMKVLHGLFYDYSHFGESFKVCGWETNIIPEKVNNSNHDGGCYDLTPEPIWFEGYWFWNSVSKSGYTEPSDMKHIPTIESYKSITVMADFHNLRGGPDTQPLTSVYAKELCNIMFLHPYIYNNCIESSHFHQQDDIEVQELCMRAIQYCTYVRSEHVWEECFPMFTYFWLIYNGFGLVVPTHSGLSDDGEGTMRDFVLKVANTFKDAE